MNATTSDQVIIINRNRSCSCNLKSRGTKRNCCPEMWRRLSPSPPVRQRDGVGREGGGCCPASRYGHRINVRPVCSSPFCYFAPSSLFSHIVFVEKSTSIHLYTANVTEILSLIFCLFQTYTVLPSIPTSICTFIITKYVSS